MTNYQLSIEIDQISDRQVVATVSHPAGMRLTKQSTARLILDVLAFEMDVPAEQSLKFKAGYNQYQCKVEKIDEGTRRVTVPATESILTEHADGSYSLDLNKLRR